MCLDYKTVDNEQDVRETDNEDDRCRDVRRVEDEEKTLQHKKTGV